MAMLDRLQGMFKKGGADEPDLSQVSSQEMAEMAAERLAPESGEAGFAQSRVVEEDSQLADTSGLVSVPLLGRKPADQHRRTLVLLLGVAVLVFAGVIAYVFTQTSKASQQLAASGQALMQSQRLAKSVSQALVGSAAAFPEVKESADVLTRSVRGLKNGDSDLGIAPLGGAFDAQLSALLPKVDAAERNSSAVLAQQKILTQVGDALRVINRQSSDLLEIAETVSSLKLQQGAPAAEISAAGQLVMLTQRIGKSANEFLTMEGVSPEAVFLLGKDLNTFKEVAEGLLKGSAELRLSAASDGQVRERLQALLKLYEETRGQAGAILGNLQGLVSAREAQAGIIADSEGLRAGLQQLQDELSGRAGLSGVQLLAVLLSGLFALASGAGLGYVQLQDSRQRQRLAEVQKQAAESLEQDAKRINDANQAAILRLMNELQTVAEGDLTQEATVTEDITGAIADSVNYTVEELRSLVGNVQATAQRVAQTTATVESTSTELLAASTEQLREIRETGQAVLDMAQRINQVSGQAQESARVARSSLQAAESGLQAVQDAIGGMNAIRDQIQETSKRIKRLGESSQEIGEITELISDITEQTNVLALNAAIQAALSLIHI